MYDDVGAHVEGEMNIPSHKPSQNLGQPDFNTLDEPIRDTIVSYICLKWGVWLTKKTYWTLQLRDVKAVGVKFGHVLFPKEKKTLLKECKLFKLLFVVILSE